MTQSITQSDPLLEVFALFMRNSMHGAILHSRELGLTMTQFSTLMLLRHKGTSPISDIAEEMGVSTAAASQMVDRMVNEGLILRTEDPHDRRVKQVSLTEKGRQMVRENFLARRAWLTELLDSLSGKEKELVSQAFVILADKLRLLEQTSNSEHGHSPKP